VRAAWAGELAISIPNRDQPGLVLFPTTFAGATGDRLNLMEAPGVAKFPSNCWALANK
jgi:hypothetical protein